MVPTIDDVASKAAVSTSTVSRAFSRPDAVRSQTRDRILAVAHELGYTPSRVARSLAGGRTSSIGLFVPDIANPFFPPIIKAVQSQARRTDRSLFIADSDEHSEDEFAIVRAMADQVDGLIVASPRMPDRNIHEIIDLVSTVVINRDVDGAPAMVLSDDDGFGQAVEHLAALGHQRMIYLAGPDSSYPNRVRRSALLAAAERLRVEMIELGPFRPMFESGTRAADLVIAQDASAVIAYNDLIALGLMARLAERGIVVGSEISVIGIDDIWLAPMAQTPLTSVRVPSAAAGTAAVRMLTDMIDNGGHSLQDRYTVPTELIVRATTGSPRR
ncbi:MAG: LacI family DNA-binding transcriptional regulator [Sciscionella sp.]